MPSPGRSNSTGLRRSGSSHSFFQVCPSSAVNHSRTLPTPLGPTCSSWYSSKACVLLINWRLVAGSAVSGVFGEGGEGGDAVAGESPETDVGGSSGGFVAVAGV